MVQANLVAIAQAECRSGTVSTRLADAGHGLEGLVACDCTCLVIGDGKVFGDNLAFNISTCYAVGGRADVSDSTAERNRNVTRNVGVGKACDDGLASYNRSDGCVNSRSDGSTDLFVGFGIADGVLNEILNAKSTCSLSPSPTVRSVTNHNYSFLSGVAGNLIVTRLPEPCLGC